MNINELKASIEKLSALLAAEEKKQETEKQEKLIELKRPAVAEQRARISQFCAKHCITPTETERENLLRVVDVLERALADKCKDYRYNPRNSCKSGARDVTKRAWTQKGKKEGARPDSSDSKK